jgi:4-amino-4-deoxy-L-arabinose transferase-like glycosyltransferase
VTEARGALRRDLLALALLGALVFLPGLGGRDLWNPDEARYTEVAREMSVLGHYALPHLNGEVYSQKPPLFFWLILVSGWLTGGIGETASRLPSALAAIGASLLVYRIGARFWNRRAGWLAALAFATCFKVLWQGRFGQIDMVLTFFVTLAVWFWVRGFTEDRPRLYLLFYAATGLATLAKGPVGLIPPLLSILAFLLITGRKAEIRRLHLPLGLLIWAAVVLVWLVPAGIDGGAEYLRQIVFRQNVTRYAEPWHHFAPWYYYLTIVPAEFFPWSLLLPAAIGIGRKRFAGREREGFVFALCWVVVTLVFFSLSPAKRSVYVLTLYPALALLVGAGLDRITVDWPAFRRWVLWPLAIVAAISLAVVIGIPIAGRGRPEAAPLGGDRFLIELALTLAPLLLGALASWWIARSGRLPRAAAALAMGMAATLLAATFVVLPRFDAIKSARGLSAELLRRMQPGDTYGIYPRLDSTFLFYTRRFAVELDSPQKLVEFARRPGRVWILIQRNDLAKLSAPLPLVPVASDPDPVEGYLLLTRPDSR